MKSSLIVALCISGVTLLLSNFAMGFNGEAELKSAIATYQKSALCPQGATVPIFQRPQFCPKACSEVYTCSNNSKTDPCIADDSSAACHQAEADNDACSKDLNAANDVINQYNAIVNSCKKAFGQRQAREAQRAEELRASANASPRGRGATDLDALIDQAKNRTNAAQAASVEDRARTLQGEREAVETINSRREASENTEQERRRQAEERAAQEEDQVEPDPPRTSLNRATNGRACFTGYQECLHDCMRTTGNEGSAGFCGMCSTQNGENCYRRR
jgi:hypothetical protein